MSSRLQRLLYEPDTEEWKRYQRKWLLGNANLYGWMAIVLFIAGVGHLVFSPIRTNSQVTTGIPDEFYIVSLLGVHPLVEDLITENEQQVTFEKGEFEVYPHINYRRVPSAQLVYSLAGQGQLYNFDVHETFSGYMLNVYHPLLEFAQSPQFMAAPNLNEDDLPEMIDSQEVFRIIQDSWGNQVLLENKYVSWPAVLSSRNISPNDEEIWLEWQLCYRAGAIARGILECSEPTYSFGTQLASP